MVSVENDEAQDDYMLTTIDNPYNPYIDFDEWDTWDRSAGYHSLSLLARVIVTSDELSEADQEVAYHDAVSEIVKQDIFGVHIKTPNPSVIPKQGDDTTSK